MSASWQPFNEKNPWGRKGTPVAGDNIEFSRERWAATKACRRGNPTAEQRMLVEETDQIIQEALGSMLKEEE
jgi:hypothetical protein